MLRICGFLSAKELGRLACVRAASGRRSSGRRLRSEASRKAVTMQNGGWREIGSKSVSGL